MRAIILAAGRGSRMKEKTDVLPKCLTEIWGKPLLSWQIEAMKKAGIKDIAVVTGYHDNEIISRYPGIHYFHNSEWDKTNMVSTLTCAEEWLVKDDCVVSYSDIVYKSKAIQLLMDDSSDFAITYYTEFAELWKSRFDNPLDDVESFKINQDGVITEIGLKANSLEEIEGQYMGLIKITPKIWKKISTLMDERMPRPLAKMDMTSLLEYLINQEIEIKGVPYSDLWLEVDSQSDLKYYQNIEVSDI